MAIHFPQYNKSLPALEAAKLNDEVGTMNDELETTAFHSSFIVPTSSFSSAPLCASGAQGR
jgi:hypothetical protein